MMSVLPVRGECNLKVIEGVRKTGVKVDTVVNLARSDNKTNHEKVIAFGRCSVRVGYCVSQVVVDIECGDGIVKAYRGANDDVAIEYSS